jgi:hypothetical protein
MTKQLVVARIHLDHPSGQYIVQGYRLKPEWLMIEDEPKIVDKIKADPYVLIASEGSREWCEAQGIRFTIKNLEKLGYNQHGQLLKSAVVKPEPPALSAKSAERVESPEESQTQQESKEGPYLRSREDVIKALEEKGKKPGDDFNPEAKVADLRKILDTL